MIEKAINPDILVLRGNKLTAASYRVLGQYLGHSPALRSLSLEWNSMNDRTALAEFLKAVSGTMLNSLDLRSNKIGANCADILVDFILQNRNLLSLDLSWNDLGSAFGLQMVEVLGQTGTLISLGLNGNNIDQTYLDQIQTRLLKNNTQTTSEKLARLQTATRTEQSGKKDSAHNGRPAESYEINDNQPRTNTNLYETLKNDLIREKGANNELSERVRELMARQSEEKSAREGTEMK